jgi:hypothetical protein
MIPESSRENHSSIDADDIIDLAFHHEIKFRAYELYQRRSYNGDGHDLRQELGAELPRVAYAAAQLQKCSNGDAVDTRAVRAARVYLRALISFINERDMD